MKVYIKYGIVLLLGLILGWFFFGDKQRDSSEQNITIDNSKIHYTCSMHPQVMNSELGSCPICGMDLIPLETNNDGLKPDQFKMTKNAIALGNIQTYIIGQSQKDIFSLSISGKIIENENNTAFEAVHFAGRIEKLYVRSVGEKINRGQLIALVYSPELVIAQRELLTSYNMKFSQPELYKAVKNKLKIWKITEQQILNIEEKQEIINNFPIYASTTGIITQKMIEEGSHIDEGGILFKVSNLNSVWADFDIYERQLSSIKKGDEVLITTNVDPSKAIKAKISFIDPILNSKTRTVSARSELNNKDGFLKPGMFVNGIINSKQKLEDKSELISVPKTAVLWTGKRSLVYVKTQEDEPIFEMRRVTLGNLINESYEVLEGLNRGDEIVVNGTFTVDAAAQLQGKKSMMNKGSIEKAAHTNNERFEVDESFQEQLKLVFDKYLLIKNALILDENVDRFSKELLLTLAEVDMKLLSDDKAHMKWVELEKMIKSSAIDISKTNKIQIQRDGFIHLSDNVISAVHAFGVNQKVFNQFCPMANNNKGANWLSLEKEIKNPYFGKTMLNCGEIISEIN